MIFTQDLLKNCCKITGLCAMNLEHVPFNIWSAKIWDLLIFPKSKDTGLLKNVEKSLYYLQWSWALSHIPAMLWFYWFQEDLVEIEFVERQPAPKPEDSLLHDDWVSCLQGCKEWSVLGRLYVGGGGAGEGRIDSSLLHDGWPSLFRGESGWSFGVMFNLWMNTGSADFL